MTQRIANFFYDNSGSINATYTDTTGATASISESSNHWPYQNTFYGLSDVEYESVKVYTGSCALQPIVTGSGFVIGSDLSNLFSYSVDGKRFSKKFLLLPTTVTKTGSGSYEFSNFSSQSYDLTLNAGVYGDGTLILFGHTTDTKCFIISDDLGKTWRYTVTPGYAAYLDDDEDYYGVSLATAAYGNGTFVVIDSRNNKYYSTDKGYTWNISEGSVKPSENYNFDKISTDTHGSQLVFDGTRFIQCAPHCEYDRDGTMYRVTMGRYSYDGIVWHNFLPQSEFIVDELDDNGISVKVCNLNIPQIFVVGTSVYACTRKRTQISQYDWSYDYHIRHVYSSSLANDDTIVSVPDFNADSIYNFFNTDGFYHSRVGGGNTESVYIPGYVSSSGNINHHYLQKFNPSLNSLSLFEFYEFDNNIPIDYTDATRPWNVKASVIGYNRDFNTFLTGDNGNQEIDCPIFNITDNTDIAISKMATIKYAYGDYYSYCYTETLIPIQSSIISGSTPPTSSDEPPTNQYFASASLISSLYFTVTGSNVNAATESIDPPMSASATVWYKWTPTEATGSSVYSITTLGSDFDTVLYLFKVSGSDVIENLVQQEWNDDYKGFTSNIDVAITGSETYYICLGGHNGDQGNYILSSSYVNPPPENDNYTTAFIMTGSSGVVTGSNRYATNEYVDGSTEYANVWWKWTPTTTKSTTINLSGSNFPIACYVYTRLNDTWQWKTSVFSTRTYTFISGSTYYFSVGGQNEGVNYRGNIRLSYT